MQDTFVENNRTSSKNSHNNYGNIDEIRDLQ